MTPKDMDWLTKQIAMEIYIFAQSESIDSPQIASFDDVPGPVRQAFLEIAVVAVESIKKHDYLIIPASLANYAEKARKNNSHFDREAAANLLANYSPRKETR